jgi:hypothetical protein
MPLAYTVEISGSGFNWGVIISKQLSICIQQAQTPKEGETPLSTWLHICLMSCAPETSSSHESELACRRAPGPRLFQRAMGEQV